MSLSAGLSVHSKMADTKPVAVDYSINNDENLEIKKAEMTGKLQRREDYRLAELQRRKEVKDSESAENESADFFHKGFTSSRQEIAAELENSEKVDKSKLPDHFALLNQKVSTLQKFVSDSAMFLPAFEIQRSQEHLAKLQKDITEKREQLIPKKKFAFKSKKKVTADVPSKSKPEISEKKEIKMQITKCHFSDMNSQTLVKQASETNDQDVALARLKECTVKIFGSPRAIHIDGLTNCKVLTGPVSGSVFIDNCDGCTFVLACQQLRTHQSVNSDFYIHVTSKAIIEDCNMLRFAPFNWDYNGMEESYKLSGLDKSRNNWSDVDDFNWLASDAHSPNWSLLEESERVTSWDL